MHHSEKPGTDPRGFAIKLIRRALAGLSGDPATMLAIFSGSAFAVLFALAVTGKVNEPVLLWPVSGIPLALLIPAWRTTWKRRVRFLSAAAAGVLLGGLIVGQPLWLVAVIAALTVVDLWIVCTILSPYVVAFEDLKRQTAIARFIAAAVLAPLVTSALGAYPVAVFLHAPVLQTGFNVLLGNSLGIAVTFPLILFMTSGRYRSLRDLATHFKSSCLPLFLFLAVSGAVFYQTRGPFLFMVFPFMILVLMLLGLEGATFTSAALTAIGWFATSHGHGPIMLMRGSLQREQLLVLQIFCWVCVATALPVGALLDERKRAESAAGESKTIYELLLQNTKDAIVLSTLDGSRRYASPAIAKITGWTPEEFLALPRKETHHPDDAESVIAFYAGLDVGEREQTIRYRIRQKDGGWRWVEAAVCAYGHDPVLGYVGTLRDISALMEKEETWFFERSLLTLEKQQMAGLAHTDPLTGLANRRALDEKRSRLHGLGHGKFAVLMIDIDFFKQYNDTYGHDAGDRCLVRVAEILRSSSTRQGDFVVRLGGEEFLIILDGAEMTGGMSIAEELGGNLRRHAIEHAGSPFGVLTVSIGVAAQDGLNLIDFDELLGMADRALYHSKHSGRDSVSAYEPHLRLARTVSF